MSARRPGRPRSEEARLAALEAVVALVGEGGSTVATMDAIARRAGVSKQTVYRWWNSPAEILMEALNEGARSVAPLHESGNFERDLRAFVRRTVLGGRGPVQRLLATLMAEAQRDPAFGESFRTGFLVERRNVLCELYDRAVQRGDLAPDLDTDFVVEFFFAALWYRLLGASGPLNQKFADRLTDALMAISYGGNLSVSSA